MRRLVGKSPPLLSSGLSNSFVLTMAMEQVTLDSILMYEAISKPLEEEEGESSATKDTVLMPEQ